MECTLKMKNKIVYPVGVIDIGSNSVRLMTVCGEKKQKHIITTRLAEGKVENRLANASILRTVNAVSLLFEKAVKEGCNTVFIFATAAVRNSINGDVLTCAVKRATGISVDVISGELEANLALYGALENLDGGVIDIGGASTEVAYCEGGQTVYAVSHEVGAVSLYQKCGREREKIKNYLSTKIKGVRRRFDEEFYAIGGTVTALASIDLALKEYIPEKIHGHYLYIDNVKKLSDRLFSLSKEEISKIYPTAKSRADVISGGVEILISVLESYGIERIKVSERDNLEGYLEYVLKNEEKHD